LIVMLASMTANARDPVELPFNTFFLLCYKRDIKCLDAEKEVIEGRARLTGSA